jgi:hypothetical protein
VERNRSTLKGIVPDCKGADPVEAYNHCVTRWLPSLLCALVLLAGCNRPAQDKEAVRQGVLRHLQNNAALDLNGLTVEITSVKFEGQQADAVVAIKPKSAPNQGMTMNYTLEHRDGKWEVKGRGTGHGGAGGGAGGGMGSAAPGREAMPESGPAKSGELPPGHPPVNGPAK